MRNLIAVVITDHIIGKGHHALAREINAAPGYRRQFAIFYPPALPMAVWVSDGGKGAVSQRAIEIAAYKKSGHTLKKNLLYGITLPLNPAKNTWP